MQVGHNAEHNLFYCMSSIIGFVALLFTASSQKRSASQGRRWQKIKLARHCPKRWMVHGRKWWQGRRRKRMANAQSSHSSAANAC